MNDPLDDFPETKPNPPWAIGRVWASVVALGRRLRANVASWFVRPMP